MDPEFSVSNDGAKPNPGVELMGQGESSNDNVMIMKNSFLMPAPARRMLITESR